MSELRRSRIFIILLVLFFGAAFFAGVLRAPDAVSVAERRKLAQLPTPSWETVWAGTFFPSLEDYTLDQFPQRDRLRTLKALVQFDVLCQRDNNGIYIVDDVVNKIEYPTDIASVQSAAAKFENLYSLYLEGTDCKAYLAIVPDKNYFTAAANGYPSLDYDAIRRTVSDNTPRLAKIDLFDCLDATSYYRTDTHWRQEKLSAVVERMGSALGFDVPPLSAYEKVTACDAFYGVYYGQSGLPLTPDTLTVLEGDALAECTVKNYETGAVAGIYTWDKLSGMDAYDVFLFGACPLLSIENPSAKTDRELVIFRDSFASSLAPLIVPAYSTVTLVDTRYMASSLVGEFLTFTDQDVLFLYSTLLLNNSATLK